MVSVEEESQYTRIILRPNRSLNWRGNQWVILSLLCISSLISIGFAMVGAWVILPFAGIEIAALTASLYYVSWKLSYCHVLKFEAEQVALEKGVYFPKYSWHFDLDKVILEVTPPNHDWEGPKLNIVHAKDSFSIGEFLSKRDSEALLGQLRRQSMRVRTSDKGKLSF